MYLSLVNEENYQISLGRVFFLLNQIVGLALLNQIVGLAFLLGYNHSSS